MLWREVPMDVEVQTEFPLINVQGWLVIHMDGVRPMNDALMKKKLIKQGRAIRIFSWPQSGLEAHEEA